LRKFKKKKSIKARYLNNSKTIKTIKKMPKLHKNPKEQEISSKKIYRSSKYQTAKSDCSKMAQSSAIRKINKLSISK